MQSINPANEQLIETFTEHTDQEIAHFLKKSNQVFLKWRHESIESKKDKLLNLIHILNNRKKILASIITQEMGKLSEEAIAEIEKCVWVCEYYVQHAAALLHDQSVEREAGKSYISFQPLGIILGIMPWNFPFWQVFRFAIPTLCAGNVVMLKHASNVSWCAQTLEHLFLEAGFPEYSFKHIKLNAERAEKLIQNPAIKAVSLTGSTQAGKSVAKACGEGLKKCVLELGGSDPYIILKDADVEKSVDICLKSRLLNAGQSCISAKRFIVEKPLYPTFIEVMLSKMQQITYGDPMHSQSSLAPLATANIRANLDEQVQKSIQQGANCLLGGKIPESKGYYYPPTLLTNVDPTMIAFEEELFGPVAVICEANDEKHAIALANHTSYGLGGAIFSSDTIKAEHIARDLLEAGSCFVNTMVKSDPRLPFGGIKQSGYGRELSSFGIQEFTNIKTVVVE